MRIVFSTPQFSGWIKPILNSGATIATIPQILGGSIPIDALDAVIVVPSCAGHVVKINASQQPNQRVLCSPTDIVKVFENKCIFTHWMLANGFSAYIPTPYMIGTEVLNTIMYPCIIKPAVACGGMGCLLQRVANPQFRADRNRALIQEAIAGDTERTAHFVVDPTGLIRRSVFYVQQQVGEYEIQGGSMKTPVKVDGTTHQPVFQEIFTKIGYCGFAACDYKLDAAGCVRIFEINPRIGGTLVNDSVELSAMLQTVREIYE